MEIQHFLSDGVGNFGGGGGEWQLCRFQNELETDSLVWVVNQKGFHSPFCYVTRQIVVLAKWDKTTLKGPGS